MRNDEVSILCVVHINNKNDKRIVSHVKRYIKNENDKNKHRIETVFIFERCICLCKWLTYYYKSCRYSKGRT